MIAAMMSVSSAMTSNVLIGVTPVCRRSAPPLWCWPMRVIYADGFTGTKAHRPELNQLLGVIQAEDTKEALPSPYKEMAQKKTN